MKPILTEVNADDRELTGHRSSSGLADAAHCARGGADHSITLQGLPTASPKLFAHRDAEKIVSERTLGDDYPITYDEIGALLDNGFGIVNRCSVTFFRTSNLPKIVGADDYLKVLRTLQDDVEAYEVRVQDDIRRARELTV